MNLSKHEEFMRIALELAVHGNPTPNPYVGCVIVKDDKIISKGYHKKCGEAHAEVDALDKMKIPIAPRGRVSFSRDFQCCKYPQNIFSTQSPQAVGYLQQIKKSDWHRLEGSTFYITLEPCTHYGRTPPCVDEIIKAKPKEVIIAMLDPNPIVKGKGIKKLKEAGIKVIIGVLEEEARELNKFYIKYITTKIPYVIMKSAVTKNWKISWGDGKNKQISSKESMIFAHELRNKVDAILVGVNTIMKDNPFLTTRLNSLRAKTKNPLRVILDSKLSIPLDANIFKDKNVVIFAGKQAQHNKKMIEKKELLRKKGVKVFVCRDEKINIKKAIYALGKIGIISVLIEGGARVNTSAIKAKIVDEIYFIVAPFEVDEKNDKNCVGVFSEKVNFGYKKATVNKLGKDFLVNIVPKY